MSTKRSALLTVAAPWIQLRIASIVLLLLAEVPGAAAQSTMCGSSQQPRQVAQLLFGRGAGHYTRVTDANWSGFVSRELSPRFPDGFGRAMA
jgi:hypothetical protein